MLPAETIEAMSVSHNDLVSAACVMRGLACRALSTISSLCTDASDHTLVTRIGCESQCCDSGG